MIDFNHSRNLGVRPRAGCFLGVSFLPALITGLGLMLAGRVTAQTFTTVYNFTALSAAYNGTNSDGAWPEAGLVLSGNSLYGTALTGGSWRNGTVFAVNTDGRGFKNLHTFTASNTNSLGINTNSDGAGPSGALILSGNTLYGTAEGGGSFGEGTVFKVNSDGTAFTTLHSFAGGIDGGGPCGGLIISGDTLYGTAQGGGTWGNGTVFAVNTNGADFTTLHSFTAVSTNSSGVDTNSDGAGPQAGLILSGNTLYGTTQGGGSSDNGTVFAVNTNGAGFTRLHSFTTRSTNSSGARTDLDGVSPQSGLILRNNTLYGTASGGGSGRNGTVFAVNTDGRGFTNLYNFTAYSGYHAVDGLGTNSDGAWPQAGLILAGNTLYGTAYFGGSAGAGTVFAINTNGTGFTNLHSFSYGDGDNPQASLILSGNTFYGAARGGGSSGTGSGTVFSITLPPPQLTITHSAGNFSLTWPTNTTGFSLQSATNLGSSANWTTNSLAPVVVNGQNTVTNFISGKQRFFRLSR